MRKLSVGLVVLFLIGNMVPILCAQTLAQVLTAVQKRQQLLKERRDIEIALKHDAWPDSALETNEIQLIHWDGASDFPQNSEIDNLSMNVKFKLLRQAWKETDKLEQDYFDRRRFESGAGLLRTMAREHFLQRLDLANFEKAIKNLAQRISRYKAIEMPLKWNYQTAGGSENKNSWSLPSLPLNIDFAAGDDETISDISANSITNIAFKVEQGSGWADMDHTSRIYTQNYTWGSLGPRSADCRAPTSFSGNIQILALPRFPLNAVDGLPPVPSPGASSLCEPSCQRWSNVAITKSQSINTTISGFFAGEWSGAKAIGTWVDLSENDPDNNSYELRPSFTHQNLELEKYYLWPPHIWSPPFGGANGEDCGVMKSRALYAANFEIEYNFLPTTWPEKAIPLQIEPKLGSGELKVSLANESANDCELVWIFPSSIYLDAASNDYPTGALSARNVLDVRGCGNWDAVYSGKPEDREEELVWPGSASTSTGRWKDFSSYLSEWWRPVLTQLVTNTYALNITQIDRFSYRVDFYRRDQVGSKSATTGRYEFPSASQAIESFTVANPKADDAQTGWLTITTKSGLKYEIQETQTKQSDGRLESNWTLSAKSETKTFFEQAVKVESPTWGYYSPPNSPSISYSYIINPLKVTTTEAKLDGVSLPNKIATYLDSWENPQRIKQLIETAANGDGTRATTYTYSETDSNTHQIIGLQKIEQTGGINPYTAIYDPSSELLTKYTSGAQETTWDYTGSTVTQTEKLNGTTVRTEATAYSGDMTRAVTTVSGATGALPAITEYYPGTDPVNPWGLKLTRGYDGATAAYSYAWVAGNFVTTVRSRGGDGTSSESVTAGSRTVTAVNQAGKVVSWQLFNPPDTPRDWATTTATAVFPTTYSRPLGRTESYAYDGQGRVTSHTDIWGKTTSITARDALGRVVTVTKPGATGGLLTWNVTYNPFTNGNLGRKIVCGGRIWEEEESPFGKYQRRESKGSAPELVKNERWEDAGAITTSSDNQTTHRFRGQIFQKADLTSYVGGNGVALAGSDRWTVSWGPGAGAGQRQQTISNSLNANLTRKYTYDGAGLPVSEEVPGPNGGTVTHSFAYVNGRLSSAGDGDGSTAYTWQSDGEFQKAKRGDRTLEVQRTSTAAAVARTWIGSARTGTRTLWKQVFTAPSGTSAPKTEDYPWGEADRKLTTTPAIADALLTQTTTGPGGSTRSRSWIDGALFAGESGLEENAVFSSTRTVDNLGQPTALSITRGSGNTTAYGGYTALGFPTTMTSPGGLANATLANTFGSDGAFTSSLTRAGESATQALTAAGLPGSRTGYGQPPEQWSAPSFGATVSRTLTSGAFSAAQQWNPAGTLKAWKFFDNTTETFEYTDGGALKKRTSAAGTPVEYQPDAFGQPTVIKVAGSVLWSLLTDNAGDLQKVTGGPGVETELSWQQGKLKTETHRGGPQGYQWVDHEYDTRGRVTKVQLSGGPAVLYTYGGPHGALDSVTTAGGATGTWSNFDSVTGRAKNFALGPLSTATGLDGLARTTSQSNATTAGTFASAYGYSALGQCNSWTTAAGFWTLGYASGTGGLSQATRTDLAKSYAFDASGAPAAASAAVGDQRPATRSNNPVVNLSGTVTTSGSPTVTLQINNGTPGTPRMRAGKITPTDYFDLSGWQTFTITAKVAGAGLNGTDAVAQEVREIYVPPASEALQYAGTNGSRSTDARWVCQWDDLEQLTRATEINARPGQAARQIDYRYDWQGRRIEKKVSLQPADGPPQLQKRVTFLYDGWRLAREIETDGNGVERARRIYTWGPDVSGTLDDAAGVGGLIEILETRGPQTTRSLALQDGKGNVTGLVDGTGGQQVAKFDYGPFGETLGASGSRMTSCPLRYQTRYYDEETGYYYFGRRYYDPTTQTFLSRDPLRLLPYYGYCYNQPLDFCDALGLAGWALAGEPIAPIGKVTTDLGLPDTSFVDDNYYYPLFTTQDVVDTAEAGLEVLSMVPIVAPEGKVAERGALALRELGILRTESAASRVLLGKVPLAPLRFNYAQAAKGTDAFAGYMRTVETLDVSTARNGAVFYSGQGNRALAESFAAANGRTTLEKTVGGRWLESQNLFGVDSALTPNQAIAVWGRLSQRFAEGASGNSVGFVQGARANGVFNTIEFPALQANPNIMNVITGGF